MHAFWLSTHQLIESDWKFADAFARSVEDGVPNCCGVFRVRDGTSRVFHYRLSGGPFVDGRASTEVDGKSKIPMHLGDSPHGDGL